MATDAGEVHRRERCKCVLGEGGLRGDLETPLFCLAEGTEHRLIEFWLSCPGTLDTLFNLCKHWFLHL